ncbi:MAG: DUF917 domain-containing protein [Chloroflexi bacterium]|nr:MAG: DUF917 domain-containing protein [Chloroflexota bacterium]
MTTLREITHDDVLALAIGAGVLGTGGGGNTYLGRLRLERELNIQGHPCPVISADDVPDDALVCAVGTMGAPTVGVEKIMAGHEVALAVRALEKHLRQDMFAIVIGEIGGSNAIGPIVSALQLGLPVVDGDPMGRAFPELQMDTFMIYGVSPIPMALADSHENVVIFEHIQSALQAEAYARSLTIEMGGSAALVMPVMTGRDMKAAIIRDTLSLAIDIGKTVLHARETHIDPAQAIAEHTGGAVLFRGKIVDVERRTVKGFARGNMTLVGFGDGDDVMEIDFQNENLIARHNGEVVCTVPDLITIVDSEDGEPIGTESLRYGLRVAVLAMPAPDELKTPQALAVVGPSAFGYDDVIFKPLIATHS